MDWSNPAPIQRKEHMNATYFPEAAELPLFQEEQVEEPSPPIPSMNAIITQLKEADQDFEWYPTTNEIIGALCRSINALNDGHGRGGWDSCLDIGAGNGKVLIALKEKCHLVEMHAIEKSSILCGRMDPAIMVVGTEFKEQSLLSKQVDVIFSNPPYSEFEQWAEKIIREAGSYIVYLVLPTRWKESGLIKDALKFRDSKAEIVGEFDFLDADRQARAVVNLIRISLQRERHGDKDDAFERFFNEAFADLIGKFNGETKKPTDHNSYSQSEEEKKKRPYESIVIGPNYPEAMVNLFRQEMEHIQRNYHLVGQLDVDLLKEFEIYPDRIMSLLRTRTNGLRVEYWEELFSHLSTITDRLTSKSRKLLLERLNKHVSVDFTIQNIYEVIVWVIKNANIYLESQFLETYEMLVDKCNVQMYKSNKKVWEDYQWRGYHYDGQKESIHHYSLNYRIVTHRVGGVDTRWGHTPPELSDSAADLLGDLLTIARNLGFQSTTAHIMLNYQGRRQWQPGKPVSFFGGIPGSEDSHELLEARGFKNRNMHLKLNQKLMLAMNVEHGRLKGWLRSPAEAAEELQEPEAAQYFGTHVQLGNGSPTLLLT
jgi:hypothetical protein